MYKAIVLVLISLLVTVGCGGGNNNNDQLPTQQPNYDPDQLDEAQDGRLDPAPNIVQSALHGRVTVEGFSLIDGQSQLVQPDAQGAELDLRLVDPGDDILSQVAPGQDGSFDQSVSSPGVSARFLVGFTVQEDIDGDGTGEDQIELAIPVALKDGASIEIEMHLRRAEEPDLDLGLLPDEGEVLIVELTMLDGNGAHEELYGVFFTSGTVIFDVDGDNVLEHGDDQQGIDQDSNGWPDNDEQSYLNVAGVPAYFEGLIVSVDVAEQSMRVRVSYAADQSGAEPQVLSYLNDSTLTVVKQSFVSLESLIMGDAPTEGGAPAIGPADFTGPVTISDRLIGHDVLVAGALSGTEVLADWIVVIE